MQFILALILFSFTNILQGQPVDRIGVEGPLEFDNTSFHLVWSDKSDDNYFIQEYLPEGEDLESFNQMLTIHLLESDIGVKGAVGHKINELTERKKTDPLVNYKLIESPDGKEFIIDFIVGEHEEDITTIVEFNVFRYTEIKLSKKRKAIVVYAYAKRGYGTDTRTFMENLSSYRNKYLKEMTSIKIPSVTIQTK